MLNALPLLLQLAAAQPLPTLDEVQFTECLTLASKDPASAISSVSLWAQEKGGYLARACHGFALASDFKFDLAVPMLTEAATLAEAKGDPRAARFWAQAGNAAIASGQPDVAVDALSNALVSNTLDKNERADSEVDRARALVALGKSADGETALATARQLAPENGAAWLLSATLARRLNKLPDALVFIQTAAALLPIDPAVALVHALAGKVEAVLVTVAGRELVVRGALTQRDETLPLRVGAWRERLQRWRQASTG